MYGEDPSAFQRQYEGEQRQQRPPEGGRQEQWQQPTQQAQPPRGQPPQGQEYAASGTGTRQPPTQQGYGTQRGTQRQQGMTQQYGQQQRSMQGQQGARQGGMQRQQYGQGGVQEPTQGQAATRAQQQPPQTQQGATQAGMQPTRQQAGGFPRTGGAQLQSVTLEEVSRSEVVTVEPDETIANVVVEMADKDVGSVIVVDDGNPVGVLTDRKIALTLGETPDVADRTAGDLVSDHLVTGTPGMSIYEAGQKLRDEGIRRLPIVDEDGKLEGIVTLDDVIVLIAGELGAAAEVIERQAPPR